MGRDVQTDRWEVARARLTDCYLLVHHLLQRLHTMIEWWGWLIVWFLYILGLCHIMLFLTIPVKILMWSTFCHTLIKYSATQGWVI